MCSFRYQLLRYAVSIVCIATMIFGLSSTRLFSQNTTRGTDFFFAYLPNYHNVGTISTDSLYLFVVAEEPTTVTVTLTRPGAAAIITNYTISNASNILQIPLAWSLYELRGFMQSGNEPANNREDEVVTNRSIRVQTQKPVACYALNQALRTSDAALIMPVTAIGKNYTVISYSSDGASSQKGQWTPSEFAVVATEDNTQVTVIPKTATSRSGTAVKNITLNAGDTWLCQALISTDSLRRDLTGTSIIADKNISVLTGHQRSLLPVGSNAVASRDHLYEQLLPNNIWGLSYIITPFQQPSFNPTSGLAEDIYRIVASKDGTNVLLNGAPLVTLKAGEFYQNNLTTAAFITSNKPIAVTQYKRSHTSSNQGGGGGETPNGDPFMMNIPPRRQYLKKYRFQNVQVQERTENGQLRDAYPEQFITVVTSSNNKDSIFLDGIRLVANFRPVPTTCYVYANIPMQDGAHTIESNRLFGLYVYGYGPANSYGYIGGMAFLPDVGEAFVDGGPDQNICVGDSAVLKAFGNVVTARWVPSTGLECDTCLSTKVYTLRTQTYRLIATDSIGCEITDEVTINIVDPATVRVNSDTSICTDLGVIIRAEGNFSSMEWSPPTGLQCSTCPVTTVYPLGREGVIKYKAIARTADSERCTAQDSTTVRFVRGPNGQLPPFIEICQGDSARLTLRNYSGTIRWRPAQGLRCDTCLDQWVKPTRTTSYIFDADSAGCFSRDTVEVRVLNSPTVKAMNDTVLCNGDVIRMNAVSNSSTVRWSPATDLSNPNTLSPQLTMRSPGTRKYYITVTVGQNCTAIDSVTITMLPPHQSNVSIRDTTICEGDSVMVTATSSDSAASFSWSPSDMSCPTCSTVYLRSSTSQVYTVTVRNRGGCVNTHNVLLNISAYPTLSLSKRTYQLCKGSSTNIVVKPSNGIIELAPMTNITMIDDSTYRFSPTATQTYRIRVRNSNGCEIEDSITVVVNDIPSVSISADTTICSRNGVATLRVTEANGYRYSWSPATSCDTCSTTTASPSTTQEYTVRISNTGGCDTTLQVTIRVEPCQRRMTYTTPTITPILACDTSYIEYKLINNGDVSQTFERIQSISIDNIIFDTDSLNLINATQLPKTVAVGETLTVRIPYWVNSAGSYNGRVTFTFNGNDTTLSVIGTTFSRPVLFTVLGNSAKPGDEVRIVVKARSDYWSEIRINRLDVVLTYPRTILRHENSSLITQIDTSQWKIDSVVSVMRGDSIDTKIMMSGTSILQGIAPNVNDFQLLQTSFLTLLGINSDTVRPHISFNAYSAQKCILANYTLNDIILGMCATDLRKVSIGSQNLQLHDIAPNPLAVDIATIRFSVPFAAQTTIQFVDVLGKQLITTHTQHPEGGQYEVDVDVSQLSNGTYMCVFTALGTTYTKPVIIVR